MKKWNHNVWGIMNKFTGLQRNSEHYLVYAYSGCGFQGIMKNFN